MSQSVSLQKRKSVCVCVVVEERFLSYDLKASEISAPLMYDLQAS